MLTNHPRAYSPEQLSALQRIFDQVYIELKGNGTLTGPADPETSHGKMARRVMRYEISRQVMSYADHHQMTDGEITPAIVDRMSITYGSGATRKAAVSTSINPRPASVD